MPAPVVVSGSPEPEWRPYVGIAPNPASGTATITFHLHGPGIVRASVLDALGREVARPADASFPAGEHRLQVPSLPAGSYVVRLLGPDGPRVARLTVVRR